jgi:hypothetical protein
MTPDLLACITPHVSVYPLAVPSLQDAADPLVRQAIIDAYPHDAAQQAAAVIHQVAVIRITVVAREAAGARFRRVAVVRVVPVTPDDHFIYRILSWNQNEE